MTRIAALAAAGLTLAAVADPPVVADPGPVGDSVAEVSFSEQVLPFFQAKCVSCHGSTWEDGELRLEAGLDLTTYEALMRGSEFGSVIEPGDPDGSILVEMVAVGDMPEEGEPATAEELEALRAWVTEGAKKN